MTIYTQLKAQLNIPDNCAVAIKERLLLDSTKYYFVILETLESYAPRTKKEAIAR